jgi:hypothetical protein
MTKRIIVCILFGFMVLGIAIAIANVLSVQSHALFSPCIQVEYHPTVPDCSGTGKSCWDCTTPQPPKN